jgi:hypothetical protein
MNFPLYAFGTNFGEFTKVGSALNRGKRRGRQLERPDK